jgi:vacuolar iron transporter family protein
MNHKYNPNYIHHQKDTNSAKIREMVFGMEDGMVSTLGSVTGIAASIGDPFTIILAGIVIVSVESVSMAVGSYLSSKSVLSIEERKMSEEREELEKYPKEEEEELAQIYVKSGWSEDLSRDMAREAAQNKDLFLEEMALRELKIIPDNMENPIQNGTIMGFSYIVGGLIPLTPYFIFETGTSIVVSISVTVVSLFALGAYVAKYSKRNWLKSGMEMFALASVAAIIGYLVGQVVERFFI